MGFMIVKGWRILSLILAAALAVSITFNIYQSINSNGSSPQNSNGNGSGLKFTFTWGPEAQNITDGEFRLEVEFVIEGENMTVIIKANDNEFHPADTVAIVFASRTGVTHTYTLNAANWTDPGFLGKTEGQWGLAFALCLGYRANQTILFDESGYTFIIKFPAIDGHGVVMNPLDVLQKGEHNNFAVCFQEWYPHSRASEGFVATEADFYLP